MAFSSTSFRPGPSVRRHRFSAGERRRGGLNSQHNLVSMRKGHDARRHRLTREEAVRGGERGFKAVMENHPEVLLWLKKKLKARGKVAAAISA